MEEFYSKPIDPKITKHSQLYNLEGSIRERQADAAKMLSLPQQEFHSCLVCGASEGQVELFTANGFPWIKCSECGLKYKKHMPTYDAMVKQISDYTVEVYMDEGGDKYRKENITKYKFDFMTRYHEGGPGRWLDLATGIADMPSYAIENGWECEATELNQSFVDAATKNFSFTPYVMTLDNYFEDFKKRGAEPFDIIGAFGYHDMLTNPIEHLIINNRLLNMGGLLGINLPDSNSLTGAMAELWPDSALRPITHINYSWHDRGTVLKMLELSGFEPVAVLNYGLDIHELITRIGEHAPEFIGSRAMDMMYEMFNDFQKVVDNHKYGDQQLWCARKVKDM